jgi:hypothetical protein
MLDCIVAIQLEIEEKQATGLEGLLDEDCHLGECNLGDLEDTSGIMETYWLFVLRDLLSRQSKMKEWCLLCK